MFNDKINNVREGIGKIRRALVLQSFIKFREYYFQTGDRKPDGQCQKEIASLLNDLVRKRGVRLAIAAPRGFAKSTIVEEFVTYCVVNKLEDFVVIISATQYQSEGHLRNIKMSFETNELLRNDFPDICTTDKRGSATRWAQDEVIFPNGVRVLALSTGKQIRGRRHGESRPSLIVLDDMELNESVRNPESACKLEDWLTKAVLKAGSGRTNVIVVGTIHHHNSLLAKLCDPQQMPGWTYRRYKAILAYAERVDLWEEHRRILAGSEDYNGEFGAEASLKFFRANEAEMLRGVLLLWPEHKSYYDYMFIRASEGEFSFDAEYQNEPINSRDCLFDLRDIHYIEDEWGSFDALLRARRSYLSFFGAWDPSLGKNREAGDLSAIVIGAIDGRTRRIYVWVVDAERRELSTTMDKILDYCGKLPIERFGVEANLFQELIGQEMRRRADQRGMRLPIDEIRNTSNKQDRIESLQPLIKSGQIVISRKHYLLLEEMRYFPKGGHDDVLDALEMLCSLASRRVHKFSERFWNGSC